MKPKYVMYIDYRAGYHKLFEYIDMDANNLVDAILEADKMTANLKESIYLIRILEKRGKILNVTSGWKRNAYEAVLCKRSIWRKNTPENYENAHYMFRDYKGDMSYHISINKESYENAINQ